MESKVCPGCKVEKGLEEFTKNKAKAGGRETLCKPCWKAKYMPKVENGLIVRTEEEELKKIVETYMLHPEWSRAKVAKHLKMSADVVSYHMRKNPYLKAVHQIATKQMQGYIPLAMVAFEESLKSKNGETKYRAASDLLKSEGILGAGKIDLTINDVSSMPVEKLVEIVKRTAEKPVEQTIIDAEVVS